MTRVKAETSLYKGVCSSNSCDESYPMTTNQTLHPDTPDRSEHDLENGSAEHRPSPPSGVTIDPSEVDKFSAMAAEWWDPKGKFKPLHKFNPVRLAFIRETVCRHFGLDADARRPFEDLRLLDIGCGGGLLSEPMTRLGAGVTGVDAAEKNIKTAQVHAREQGLQIDYRAGEVEDLTATGERFDVILNMEVVEHVADVNAFLGACADLLKPGGVMIVATINRTLKAYALAIVGAEQVLGWLPKGTHQYEKLVRPIEIRDALTPHGLTVRPPIGVSYNPLLDRWARSRDPMVNYMVVCEKPAA